MGIIKKTINFTSNVEVPIDASDQPMYAIWKEVPLPIRIWTRKIHMCTRDLHMEHTGLLVHGNFIKENGLDTLFLHSKLSTGVIACKFLWLPCILCSKKHTLKVEALYRG